MQHRQHPLARITLQARSGRRQPSRQRAAGRSRRPSSPVRRTLFHAPSFSAGVVMGAVVVLGAAYLPELMSRGEASGQPIARTVEPRPELTFEFDQLLRNSAVTADPDPYASEPEPAPQDAREEILLQAASFRSRDDAERLRAALLLMDLPATTSAITLSNGAWYRVTVGPFDRRVEAERALTQLREKNIAAIWTRRPKR